MDLPAGSVVGKYVVVDALRGGNARSVFAAYDPDLDRKVALRFVADASEQTTTAEAAHAALRTWARLKHPNVVAVHDTGSRGEGLWVATEFVDGPTLSEWLSDETLQWPQIVDRFCSAADALLAARAHGLGSDAVDPERFRIGSDGRVRCIELDLASDDTRCDGRAFFGSLTAAFARSGRRRLPTWLRRICERGASREAPLQAGVQSLRNGRRRARQRRLLAGAAASMVLAGGLLAARHLQRHRLELSCVEQGASIAAVWSEAVEERVTTKLRARPEPYADTTATAIGEQFGAFRDAWQQTKTEACLDSIDADRQQSTRLGRVAWCLADRRQRFSALVTAMDEAGEGGAHRAAGSATLLPAPSGCADPATAARLPTAPPLDRREVVSEVRAAMADARAVGSTGDDPRALEMATAARAKAESVGWPPLVAMALDLEASQLHILGRTDEAFQRATRAYEVSYQAGEWDVAAAAASRLTRLAGTVRHDLELVRAWAGHAAMAIRLAGDDDEAKAARLAVTLGAALVSHNRFDEAEREFRRAVEIRTRVFGEDHPRVASVLASLGLTLHEAGRHDDALAVLTRALRIKEATFGPDHVNLVTTLINLGNVHDAMRRYADVRAVSTRALSIQEAAYGPDNPRTGMIRLSLVVLAMSEGEHDRAQAELDQLLPSDGPPAPLFRLDQPRAQMVQAALYSATGQGAKAQAHYRDALRLYEDILGTEADPRVAVAYTSLGSSLVRTDDFEAAIDAHQRALQIRRSILGPEHDLVAESLWFLSVAERESGDERSAATHGFEALRIAEAALGPDNPRVASILATLVNTYRVRGQLDLAEQTARRALPIIEGAYGASHPFIGASRVALAKTRLAQGEPADALTEIERAVEIFDTAEGTQDGEFAAHFLLAQIVVAAGGNAQRARLEANKAIAGWRAAGNEERAEHARAWLDALERR